MAAVSELRVTWLRFRQLEIEEPMTANISEHLKKVEWPTPRAWKIAFHAIDGALASRLLTRPVPDTASQPRLLNFGCGPVRYPEWVNADFIYF
jgi:hypothetical protein